MQQGRTANALTAMSAGQEGRDLDHTHTPETRDRLRRNEQLHIRRKHGGLRSRCGCGTRVVVSHGGRCRKTIVYEAEW